MLRQMIECDGGGGSTSTFLQVYGREGKVEEWLGGLLFFSLFIYW